MSLRYELARIVNPNAFSAYESQVKSSLHPDDDFYGFEGWELLYYLDRRNLAAPITNSFSIADQIIKLFEQKLLNQSNNRHMAGESVLGLQIQVYKWEEPHNQANLSFEKPSNFMVERYATHWSTPPHHLEVQKLVDIDDVRNMIRFKFELDSKI